jgi:hypothetical protein
MVQLDQYSLAVGLINLVERSCVLETAVPYFIDRSFGHDFVCAIRVGFY